MAYALVDCLDRDGERAGRMPCAPTITSLAAIYPTLIADRGLLIAR
jgi:hypothetical protein